MGLYDDLTYDFAKLTYVQYVLHLFDIPVVLSSVSCRVNRVKMKNYKIGEFEHYDLWDVAKQAYEAALSATSIQRPVPTSLIQTSASLTSSAISGPEYEFVNFHIPSPALATCHCWPE